MTGRRIAADGGALIEVAIEGHDQDGLRTTSAEATIALPRG